MVGEQNIEIFNGNTWLLVAMASMFLFKEEKLVYVLTVQTNKLCATRIYSVMLFG